MDKIGLVLSGGGARGAFELGVWEALDECGLAKDITGFSGTSIGAINTALFLSQQSIAQKEDMWLSMKQADLVKPNIDIGIHGKLLRSILSKWNYLMIVPDILFNGIFTQNALKDLIERLDLDYSNILSNYDVFTSVTDMSINYIGTGYIDWKSIPDYKIKRYIRYSAKLPLINGAHISKKRLGHLIMDGGVRDVLPHNKNLSNTPIAPLYARGYRKFIVVYLSRKEDNLERIEKENKWFTGSEICRIFLDRPKKLTSVITINPDLTHKRIEQGEEAVYQMLNVAPTGELSYETIGGTTNQETIAKTLEYIKRGELIVNGR